MSWQNGGGIIADIGRYFKKKERLLNVIAY